MKKEASFTVELKGGLGNQLFGYFAGTYMREKTGAPVYFDHSLSSGNSNHHGSSLASFQIPAHANNSHGSKKILSRVSQFMVWPLLRRTDKGRRYFCKIFSCYKSEVVGFDPLLLDCKPGTLVQGYFQTYKYFCSLGNPDSKTITLKNPSNWYLDLSIRAQEDSPVMIHVRRGDYGQAQNSYFGQLSPAYFMNAVIALKETLHETDLEIWVFSDEIERVEAEFSTLGLSNVTYVKAPPGTDPAEELMLMSLGGGLITSNSTFSLWAGLLSKSQVVVSPSKWFQHRNDPDDLIPPLWIKCASDWL